MKNNTIKKIILPSIIIIFVFVGLLITNSWITNKKNETDNVVLEARIVELESLVDEYRTEYEKVLDIKQEYRTSISQIFELLYNRSAPLQIGGRDRLEIDQSDRIILLQLRQTINTMTDDQEILNDVEEYLHARRTFIENFPFTWPIETNGVPRLSSSYGFRDDIFNNSVLRFHRGIDIPGEEGDPILASASGTVRAIIRNDIELGNIIVLQHRFGFTTGYSHLKDVFVTEGQIVERGETIGSMGNEGTHSLGAHVHYEIRKNGNHIDPMLFLSVNY